MAEKTVQNTSVETHEEDHQVSDISDEESTSQEPNVLNEAEDIQMPRFDKDQLTELVQAFSKMDSNQQKEFMTNMANLNKMNPNGKEFAAVSQPDLRKRLREKIRQSSISRSSRSSQTLMVDKMKKKQEEEQKKLELEKEKRAARNRKRKERRKRQKTGGQNSSDTQDSLQSVEVEEAQPDDQTN